MGEYVWTTLSVGGKVKRSDVPELQKAIDAEGWEDGDTLTHGQRFVAAGTQNYGNIDDSLHHPLQALNLTYRIHFCAQPGCFSSGLQLWKPGFTELHTCDADDDGAPLMSIYGLKKFLTLKESIDELTPFAEDLPPIEIIDD